MATRLELLELVKSNPDSVVNMLLEMSLPTGPLSSSMTVEEILNGTVRTVKNRIEEDMRDLQSIRDKLSNEKLDKLVEQLRNS